MKPISDVEAILLHRILAEYHQRIATNTRVALKHDHHYDFADKLEREALFIEEFLPFANEPRTE
jgi:hypothetical protein